MKISKEKSTKKDITCNTSPTNKQIIDECPICYENKVLYSSIQCSHMFCHDCKQQLKNCAICRTPIQRKQSYLSYLDSATQILMFNNYNIYDFSFNYFSPIVAPRNSDIVFDFSMANISSSSSQSSSPGNSNESYLSDNETESDNENAVDF